jgi:hypothetical protein
LGLGGFDPQFRQAGDDVDVCWRMLDADLPIGYAAGAMVWHHRRATARAYAKQQKGYGRSEAMVHFKHPQRCGSMGRSRWGGIIYGDGAVGLPLMPETIYHGRFGGGLFQTIYRHNQYGLWSVLMSLEWHLLAMFILVLAILFWPLAVISLVMESATLCLALRSAWQAPLPRGASLKCRLLVAYLYLMQPIWRGWYRMTYLLRKKRLPVMSLELSQEPLPVRRISASVQDLYWQSDQSLGREILLEVLVNRAKRHGWYGEFDNAWADWDVKLVGDRWHDILIRTATEELGWPNRFTRARCRVRPTLFTRVLTAGSLLWSAAAVVSFQGWALLVGLAVCLGLLLTIHSSRRKCLRAATQLAASAADLAGLANFEATSRSASAEAALDAVAGLPEKEESDSGIVRAS